MKKIIFAISLLVAFFHLQSFCQNERHHSYTLTHDTTRAIKFDTSTVYFEHELLFQSEWVTIKKASKNMGQNCTEWIEGNPDVIDFNKYKSNLERTLYSLKGYCFVYEVTIERICKNTLEVQQMTERRLFGKKVEPLSEYDSLLNEIKLINQPKKHKQ